MEPSLGADRVTLAFLVDAYDEGSGGPGQERQGRRPHRSAPPPRSGPLQVRRAPLSKKLGPAALEIRDQLSKEFMVDYDEAGSIGKRYRRQDEIGTPLLHHRGLRHRGRRGEGGRPLRHRPGPGHHGAGPAPIAQLKDYLREKVTF